MRLSILSLALLTGLCALSCSREVPREPTWGTLEDHCVVQFTLKTPATKSVLPGDIENRLDNAFVLITSEDGYSRFQFFDFTKNPQGKSVEWRLPAGREYTLYAVGNMGNILKDIPKTEEGFNMADFRYEVPPYSQITAMPMAHCQKLSANRLAEGSHVEIPISLERLMAQVNVRIDKSGITGGDGAHVMQSASIHLRQVAKGLYPFRAGGSKALTDNDVFSGETDYYVFSAAEAWKQDSGVITLYVPENCQGQLLSPSALQADKSAGNAAIDALPQKRRLTYIEYVSAKNGQADGVSGSLVYRGYLGANESNDFSIERNRRYTATLALTWDGFTWKADGWRIDRGDDWNDARRLAFLDANGNAIHYLKIHKKGSGEAYAYFDIAAGSGTAGRKDASSYPYGWYLTGNDATLSGHDGSGDRYTVAQGVTVQCLGTATVGGKAVTRLLFSASSAASVTTDNASLRHHFGLHTMDGALHSERLDLDVEDLPFEFNWLDGAPTHVAQRGILRCVDPYTGQLSSEGVFHLKDGYSSKVRMVNNGDGTATISVVKDFAGLSDAIYITDADGDRRCNVPLEGRIPWFECTSLVPETNYIDAQGQMSFTYFKSDADGHKSNIPMQVVDNGTSTAAVTVGNQLDLGLVDELFPPKLTSNAGRLAYDRQLTPEGHFIIYTHVQTYEGINSIPGYVSGERSFLVDEGTISMENHSDRGTKSCSFVSWNPWYLWFQDGKPIHNGGVMNDYTLYHEPKGWKSAQSMAGWEENPSYKPTETASYSTELTNLVVSSLHNIKLDASFIADGGYIGDKVCTGTPSNVDSDFTPSTRYQLIATVANMASYDWEALGDFLWFNKGHHYLTSVWENPAATQAERKAEMDRVLADQGSLVLSSWVATAAEAWTFAPSGVSASSPDVMSGVHFSVRAQHISSRWTMTYSMAGLGDDDIETHNAGKINIVLRVINPYNNASPSLDNTVATAYVKLHLYIWPQAVDVKGCAGYMGGSGWYYSAFPFCYTENRRIAGLDKYGFWTKEVILPAEATYTSASQTFITSQSSAGGCIRTNYNQSNAPATWQFYNNNAFQATDTPEKLKQDLMTVLSAQQQTSLPFTFRSTNNTTRTQKNPDGSTYTQQYTGLNNVLGTNTFYRENNLTLYYDPTGSSKTYTYTEGSDQDRTDKLFVIHINDDSSHIGTVYYFDPNRFGN